MFGANGVLGRPISALELKRIGFAEKIVNICRDRNAALNAVTWEKENPVAAIDYKDAMKLAMDEGLI